jgi:hypothetical protein
MKANRSPRRDTYSSLGPRVDPLRTCRQFIASLCPGHKTGHKQNGKLFFPCIGCFICILMNFSTVDSSFSSIFMASTRTKIITFRSLCMYAKTYAGYYSERSSTRIFCPKFVLGHERARERAAILGSLTRCRDFVSVVPEPME